MADDTTDAVRDVDESATTTGDATTATVPEGDEESTAGASAESTGESGDSTATCSLTPEEAIERLAWAAETLEGDLRDLRVEGDRLVWTFDRTEQAIAGVTTLAEREAACCSFATVTVTIPPEGVVTFRMDVPEGSADALIEQFADVADPRELV